MPDILLKHVKRYKTVSYAENQPQLAVIHQLLLGHFDSHLFLHILDCPLPHFLPVRSVAISYCKE